MTKSGFFEANCRVRAIKLRGEYSLGFIIPIAELETFVNGKFEYTIGDEFDAIGDIIMLEKYIVKQKETQGMRNGKIEKRISRIVENQFRFHIDTDNLRRCSSEISPDDIISITYKYHGTSAIYANVLTRRELSFFERIAKRFGVNVVDSEYDILYSSRKVVKNEYETKDKKGFYDSDIWGEVKKELFNLIPKGYTIYGEIVGFTPTEKEIQPQYDYGCAHLSHKFLVYRITFTNIDGNVFELSTPQINAFCEKQGMTPVKLFYYGRAGDFDQTLDENYHWNENFIKRLEEKFTEKKCEICFNDVIEEGVVIRKENHPFSFEAYKLKSFGFMEYETKMMDSGNVDIES